MVKARNNSYVTKKWNTPSGYVVARYTAEHGFHVLPGGEMTKEYETTIDEKRKFVAKPEYDKIKGSKNLHTHPLCIYDPKFKDNRESVLDFASTYPSQDDIDYAKNYGPVVTIYDFGISVTEEGKADKYIHNNDLSWTATKTKDENGNEIETYVADLDGEAKVYNSYGEMRRGGGSKAEAERKKGRDPDRGSPGRQRQKSDHSKGGRGGGSKKK
jgi:hypothetical protein